MTQLRERGPETPRYAATRGVVELKTRGHLGARVTLGSRCESGSAGVQAVQHVARGHEGREASSSRR